MNQLFYGHNQAILALIKITSISSSAVRGPGDFYSFDYIVTVFDPENPSIPLNNPLTHRSVLLMENDFGDGSDQSYDHGSFNAGSTTYVRNNAIGGANINISPNAFTVTVKLMSVPPGYKIIGSNSFSLSIPAL